MRFPKSRRSRGTARLLLETLEDRCLLTLNPAVNYAVAAAPLDVVVGDFTGADDHVHGYLLKNGVFTQIDYPGADNTTTRSINVEGVIAGFYENEDGFSQAILVTGSNMVAFDFPGTSGTTGAFAINALGEVVGDYFDADGNDHGYLRRPQHGHENAAP